MGKSWRWWEGAAGHPPFFPSSLSQPDTLSPTCWPHGTQLEDCFPFDLVSADDRCMHGEPSQMLWAL